MKPHCFRQRKPLISALLSALIAFVQQFSCTTKRTAAEQEALPLRKA
jgi:hypothetical protein